MDLKIQGPQEHEGADLKSWVVRRPDDYHRGFIELRKDALS